MLDGKYATMIYAVLKNPENSILQNINCTATYITSISEERNKLDTMEEVRTNS